MNLFDLLVLILVVVVAIQFWRARAIAETAKDHLRQYCEQNGLQLISVARHKTRISTKGKLDWRTEFNFEFSGNGEDSYQGKLTMVGLQIIDTQLPAYRVN